MSLPKANRSTLLCVLYVGLHLAAHLSAGWFEVSSAGVRVSIWYAPAGLALSLLVLLGPRHAPVVFGANFLGALLTGGAPNVWVSWLFPALITTNYAVTAWWVRRYVGTRLIPGDRRSTVVFCLTIVGSPLVLATIGTALAMTGEPPTAAEFWGAVFDWWIGDASGLLTVVPVAAVLVAPWLEDRRAQRRPVEWKPGAIVITAGVGLVLIGSVGLVQAVTVLREHYAFFLSFLPLVWICMQHGMRGAVIATLAVTLTGLVGMRLTGSTADFAYVFLLFEVAVAGVGLGLGNLVSRRQRVERALAQNQAQLDRVIAGAKVGLWDWHVASGRIDTNNGLAAMLGYEPGELEPFQERWPALLHPLDIESEQAARREHLAGTTPIYETPFRVRTREGQWHWVMARGSVVQRDHAGQPVRVSGLFVDINARKRAESEIGRLFRIIEATPDYVFTTDMKGTVIYTNQALEGRWGLPGEGGSWMGKPMSALLGESGCAILHREAIPSALSAGIWQGEHTFVPPSGRELPVAVCVLAHRDEETDTAILSFILRDLTAQKEAEAERIRHEREIMQVQKNESLGVLAGGIAHDFNNLMMSVVGSANLARVDVPEGGNIARCLDTMEQAAVRASALCQQMLAYAGRSPVEFAELDLNQLVEDTLKLLHPSIPKKISVRFLAEHPLPHVLAATTQAQQVVMNLVLNAVAAIGNDTGRINLRTHYRRYTAQELADWFQAETELEAGDYLTLSVEDDGCGMSDEVRARIFEPFYSTKFSGSGLGLAVVMGFLRAHRGGVSVRSEVGEGSRFTLVLPVLGAVSRKLPPETGVADDNWTGSGKILLVDDDATLLRVIELMLINLGFEVILARDGIEGVQAFREHQQDLRGVLLDLTMPRMDGFEAHAAMNAVNSKVPVILISGYSQRLANLPPQAIHPAGVLGKPFNLSALRMRLKSVLGRTAKRD